MVPPGALRLAALAAALSVSAAFQGAGPACWGQADSGCRIALARAVPERHGHAALRARGPRAHPPCRMAAGGGRESDAVVFMPGASPRVRTESKRWEQWYAAGPDGAAGDAAPAADAAEAGVALSGLEQLTLSTERSLDWHVIKAALANCSRTPMGRRALASMAPLATVAEVERAYNALEEVRLLADQGVSLPISQVHDIVALSGVAGKGDILDLEELKDCAGTLVAMLEISKLLDGRNDTATLTDIAQDVDLNPEVVRLFERSFDAAGQLSVRQYPQLDVLRKEIQQIEASVTKTMDSLVKDTSISSTLQDKFYTIRENRFVLPVAVTNKNKLNGIVHGMSGSGSTVYIEPQQVIDLNNRLRLAQGELKAEEQRIRSALSQKLGSQARQIRLATKAVVEMDCAFARENLGATMTATRPTVGEDNEVVLTKARHPVLVLRGVKPVANSVQLTAERPALVISVPPPPASRPHPPHTARPCRAARPALRVLAFSRTPLLWKHGAAPLMYTPPPSRQPQTRRVPTQEERQWC